MQGVSTTRYIALTKLITYKITSTYRQQRQHLRNSCFLVDDLKTSLNQFHNISDKRNSRMLPQELSMRLVWASVIRLRMLIVHNRYHKASDPYSLTVPASALARVKM